MTHEKDEILGTMILAKTPCGKIAAAAWKDSYKNKTELKNDVTKWLEEGRTVSEVERRASDPKPEWICFSGCKECLK